VTIFTLWFENFPNNLPALLISAGVALLFVVIFAKAAISADGRSRWVRRITGPNGKWFFGLLFVGWAVVFGVGLQLVPHQGSSSPYGGLGLIALFSGVFISMGFLWSVIGE
jgi:2-polyprenyl-6-methoxyphenol hydroxylase-like FAD-dependent oxidoreductase